MHNDEANHADVNGLMSNLEFFAAAPIGIARRALALAGLIVDGRGNHAPGPPGNHGPGGDPDAATTRTGAENTEPPPEPAAPSDDNARAAAVARPDRKDERAQHGSSRPAAEPPQPAPANAAPKKTGARRRQQTKTTPEIVRAIRQEYDGSEASRAALAERYGMGPSNVQRIATRARWKNVPAEPGDYEPSKKPPAATHKVNAETVHAIRREYQRTPTSVLADRHGVSEQTVRDIGNRRTWKDLPVPGGSTTPERPGQRVNGHAASRPGTSTEARSPAAAPKTAVAETAMKPEHRTGTTTAGNASRETSRREAQETNLSDRQAREVRRRARSAGRSEETIAKLADEFDVPPATIEAVIDRRAWAHLQPRDDEYDPVGQSVWDGRAPLS